jgi:Spy/CpxP family protein refolding chaperone
MRVLGFCMSGLLAFMLVGASISQEPKPADPKAPKETKGVPKDAKADPKTETKAKGQLPQNWKQLGLTDDQTQKVYKVQTKYNEDIDKLKAQIEELKAKMAKERNEVLTPEQKKRLEDILKAKADK